MSTLKKDLINYSQNHREPQTLQEIRLAGATHLEQAPPLKVERLAYSKWLDNEIATEALKMPASTWELAQIDALRAQGVYVADFKQAAQERPELLEKYFIEYSRQYIGDCQQLAMQQALFNDGLVIYFPKGFQLKETLHLRQALPQIAVQNVLIVLDEQVDVDLAHTLTSKSEEAGQAHVLIEVITEPSSRLRYLSVNELKEQQPAYILRTGFTARDAAIYWKQVELGQNSLIADLRTHLLGEGSESILEAIAISSGQQTVGINSQITNHASHTNGDIHQKGVALDESTLTFNGIGHIIKRAKEANSQQESRILMLSDQARGDTNPILLIDEFEVMAGHAASIGQIPPEDLYYLTSRGIHKKEALRMYARGFLKSTITGEYPDAVLDLEHALREKMILNE